MPAIKKLVRIYNSLEEILLIYTLMLMVLVVFLQVVMRYVFNNSLSWSEELVRYLFVWQIWLGASLGVKNNNQIRVEILPKMLKSLKAREALELVCNILLVILFIVVLVTGFRNLENSIIRNITSVAMKIPMSWVFASLPIASFVIIIRLICRIIYEIVRFGHTAQREIIEGGDEA